MKNYILLTIDVEDWFQVENFKSYIPLSSWFSRELRVEKNTNQILDLLDSQKTLFPARATFFMLGWLAKRLPHLVYEIHKRGHEIASHGYYHNLCINESDEKIKTDLTKTKNLLEDIIGQEVTGYRAPSFSINDNVLKIIENCGYIYDSSYNSFEMHGRYGHVNLSNYKRNGAAVKISDNFFELPVSNLKIKNHVIPWGGGGYFRLMPFFLFRKGIKAILNRDNAYIFYMHPWELDPKQPRVVQASSGFKFRHYTNLDTTKEKLNALFRSFKECSFITCHKYLNIK
ncbi:Polysaccharide deacetylase family protein [Desulfonema limicola]|uniref:Polysaccharide deacetylase family protein n=1 Tax=Desulfonema limicola TaxID=45656 RepID=A0A975B5F0_9BACT|nr:XrtA system polysaccharide deacetylase [Desulfonema limicola]QTA79098.1 Polysaccharide deacetylase family protein [Desulfonema limicola]